MTSAEGKLTKARGEVAGGPKLLRRRPRAPAPLRRVVRERSFVPSFVPSFFGWWWRRRCLLPRGGHGGGEANGVEEAASLDAHVLRKNINVHVLHGLTGPVPLRRI